MMKREIKKVMVIDQKLVKVFHPFLNSISFVFLSKKNLHVAIGVLKQIVLMSIPGKFEFLEFGYSKHK